MNSKYNQWELAPPASPKLLQSISGLPPLLVHLLSNRGISSGPAMFDFLASSYGQLGDPFQLKDMERAVQRIRHAVELGEQITVFGDFDVDGVTSTALLVQTLRTLGGLVSPYIPNRKDEGCGLNTRALDHLKRQKTALIITADCGSSSYSELCYARELELDVIVTDHHQISEDLPPAYAFLNPQQSSCSYGFKQLAGVGLAFKLAQALLESSRRCRQAEDVEVHLLDLVALGTISDLAPLLGENRILVKHGLQQLTTTRRPGLRCLIDRLHLDQTRPLEVRDIAYGLGPRLNAAGRMDDALLAYQLLMTTDEAEAQTLAEQLELHNLHRQQQTEDILQKAREQAVQQPDRRVLFVAGQHWPLGVVGVVASKLTEEYHRPVIALSLGDTESRGSSRCMAGFSILDALVACRPLLLRFGGHAHAAGLTLLTAKVPAFQEAIEQAATAQISLPQRQAVLPIDSLMSLSSLTPETYNLLQQLAPFGFGNPVPVFACQHLQIARCRAVGYNRNHLKLSLSDGQTEREALAPNMGNYFTEFQELHFVDVAFTYETHRNSYTGEEQFQMKLCAIEPSSRAII